MIRASLCIALATAATACNRPGNEEPPPLPDFSEDGAGVQRRVTQYLEGVVPKVRTCWSQLQGEGAIATDMVYRKSGSAWTLDSVRVTRSTLAKGQETTAEQCLSDAARGSSFAVDANERLEQAASKFVVRLGWLIPLPPPNTELTKDQVARMIGTGGVITVPGCSNCVSNPNPPYGLKCESKSSGSNVDCEEISSNVCATTPRACMRGVFGGSRGVIMF